MQYQDNQFKWVVVVNRKAPLGRVLNAVGHLALGMRMAPQEEASAQFHAYKGPDGQPMAQLSHWPVIVLQAKTSSQLLALRTAAIAAGVSCQSFVEAMIGPSAEHQLEATRTTPLDQQEFIAVMLFGKSEDQLRPLTKKFSLFASPVESPLVESRGPVEAVG
ncbi:MAG: DUF2000 family protein [Planctomycetaceae bacterium]